MQITPLPTPPLPTALPQEAVTKAIPQVQAEAVAQSLISRAVDPSPRSEKGHKSRSNGDKAKGGASDSNRGKKVNLRV
jgi:hypothetical protein